MFFGLGSDPFFVVTRTRQGGFLNRDLQSSRYSAFVFAIRGVDALLGYHRSPKPCFQAEIPIPGLERLGLRDVQT